MLDTAFVGVQDDLDKNETEGGIKVEFKGRSGKFLFKREGTKERTEVRLKKVIVMDANEDKKCREDDAKDFTAEINESAKMPGPDGVEAHQVKFMANLGDWGKVVMDTYLAKAEGETGLNIDGAETFPVKQGNLKFNIELYDFTESAWGANGGCKEATHVDVELDIKSAKGKGNKGKGASGKGRRQDDDIGDDFLLQFDAEISIDGNLTLMPEGYPAYQGDGGGKTHKYTFRVPKFEDKMVYDPNIADDSGCKKLFAFTALAFPMLRSLFA